MKFLNLRRGGYKLLSGHGIEIGAFEHPAQLASNCTVEYVDVISTADAMELFPEVDVSGLKNVDHIIDISKGELLKFDVESFDFVIINHVLEHVPNPIGVLKDIFHILKTNGKLVIGIPDKDYTFDKKRPLTSFDYLKSQFEQGVVDTVPEDYRDMIIYVHPELLVHDDEHISKHLAHFKKRREHVNIWNSESFIDFANKTFELLAINTQILYEIRADESEFEYFSVLKKI